MDDTSRRPNLVGIIAGSKPVEIALTLVVYAVYAAVVGVSLIPSSYLMLTTLPALIEPALAGPGFPATLRAATLIALTLAAALYLYLFWGALVQAALIRLLSLGIGAGRYPALSFTTLRWLIFSGIYTVSMRTILPLVPVSFVTNLFFRIIGCRMGRNVKINTNVLNDAYLLTIGDNVIVGGQTDISCHLFEHDHLVLRPITIGSDTLIGAHSYVSPGVTIGSRCVIGLHSYIRTGRVIPDGSTITSLAGIDVHTARHIERGRVVPHPSTRRR
ncbi:MAG: DapH/DapD/GlmU-related protein [Spirochaetota bacterium]